MKMRGFIIAVCIILAAIITFGVWSSLRSSDIESEEGTILPFKDVPKDAWYYTYVSTAYDYGWVEGYSHRFFSPETPLERGDFAQILYRYLGQPDVSGLTNPFTDLDNTSCKDGVIYLKTLGILDGKTDTLFSPEEYITREQLVTILYRLGGSKVDKELSPSGKYADRSSISPWALDAVDWAIHNGLLSGYTESALSPQEPASRAQAVKILCLYGELTGYGADNKTPTRTVKLTVWHAGVDNSHTALTMKKLLNRFENRNPGVTVDYVPIPSQDDPYNKVQSALQKVEGPDVILVSAPYEMLLADQSLVLPLDTLLTDSVLADVHPGLLLDCTYNREANPELRGKVISAPLFSTPRALLVSRSLFDRFGVSYPDNTYTYERLQTDVRSLTGSKDGKIIYGLGTGANSPGFYLGMVWSNGGTILDPNTGLAATDTTAWKKATEAYLSLYTEGITPDHSAAMDYNTQLNMFANGTVSMIDGSLSSSSLIQKQKGWEDNLSVYPFLDNAQSAALCVGEVAVISHCTENIVDSAKLINFLMDPDSQVIYAEEAGYLPGVMSVLTDGDLKTDAYLSPYVPGVEDTAALGTKGYVIYELIRNELQKVLRGEISVEDYCTGLEQKINEILQSPITDMNP